MKWLAHFCHVNAFDSFLDTQREREEAARLDAIYENELGESSVVGDRAADEAAADKVTMLDVD